MSNTSARMFTLTIRSLWSDDCATIRALRQLLKQTLRQHRFRCETIQEVNTDEQDDDHL